jgi:hypothetical protein
MFSRDRAMQADATLRSFFLHCLDAREVTQVYVIYKATSARHASQYERLAADYPLVEFLRQGDFRSDVLRLLDPYPAGRLSSRFYHLVSATGASGFRPGTFSDRYLRRLMDMTRLSLTRALLPRRSKPPCGGLFLVDDNLFVRDFELRSAMQALVDHPDALGFSLRLGRNTLYCYSANQTQSLPAFSSLADNRLKFCWGNASHDFGYPLEVSSSLYLDAVLAPFLAILPFRNPNELEAAMASRARYFRASHPALICYERSVTFCNPVNIVQSTYINRAGGKVCYTVDDLLERFERSERVDVAAYDGFIPNACHQEVELVFVKGNE